MRAKVVHSDVIEELLGEIDPVEYAVVENSMRIAAKINEALRTQNISIKQLSDSLGYNSSYMVTQMMSGTFQFHQQLLEKLEQHLNIKLQ